MSDREDLETGVATLLAPLKVAGKLKSIEAVGGEDWRAVLDRCAGKAPFAMVKYSGKVGELLGGGLHRYISTVSVVLGVKNFKGANARRGSMTELLQLVEEATAGVVPATGFSPMAHVAEEWTDIDEESGLEVWTVSLQTYYHKGRT